MNGQGTDGMVQLLRL